MFGFSGLSLRDFRENWKSDFSASLVVFLVALPLCMGIAIASGAPPAAGLISGIVGGLVVGTLAGSPLQVTGPAAGLSVIVFDIVQQHGLAALGWIVFLAGVIQCVAGMLRVGQWFRAVSPAVIHGMLAGIGILIIASQFHVMVDDAPKETPVQSLLSLPSAVIKGVTPTENASHHWAAMLGLLTIVVILSWKPLAPKRLRFLPAPLIGICAAAFVSEVFKLPVRSIEIPDSIIDAIQFPALAVVSEIGYRPLIFEAFVVATIASAETLLCCTAVDAMHSGQRTKYDRELGAQGVGNMICGLLGGLPVTGVIVRSSANVDAGAKTRLSAILHGAWLLLFIAVLPFALRLVPVSSLAALLVYTGYKLVSPKAIKTLWSYGKSEVAIYATTVAVIVIEDLLTGVVVGVILSAIKLLYTFSSLSIDFAHDPSANRTTLKLHGSATFIRLPKLAAMLESVPPDAELHVDCEHLTYIDHACLDLLMNWAKQHRATGGKLSIDWETLNARFAAPNGNGNGTASSDGDSVERTPELQAAGAKDAT